MSNACTTGRIRRYIRAATLAPLVGVGGAAERLRCRDDRREERQPASTAGDTKRRCHDREGGGVSWHRRPRGGACGGMAGGACIPQAREIEGGSPAGRPPSIEATRGRDPASGPVLAYPRNAGDDRREERAGPACMSGGRARGVQRGGGEEPPSKAKECCVPRHPRHAAPERCERSGGCPSEPGHGCPGVRRCERAEGTEARSRSHRRRGAPPA